MHHLSEDRGSTLETVVVRMKLLNETYRIQKQRINNGNVSEKLRIIALSATLPNLVDIGHWIGCEDDGIWYFDDSYRPVPLTVHTLSMGHSSNTFLFEKSLDSKVAGVISRYSEGKPVLIFCSSKRGTENLCEIITRAMKWRRSPQEVSGCEHRIRDIQDRKLQSFVRLGYG